MALRQVQLEDKYTVDHGRVFVTGIQALVRLPMLQFDLDRGAGLRTAGYITGYRGSPLGGLDIQLGKARGHLESRGIVFVPGVNEELAATALWGAQQAEVDGEGRYDGVFGMWYGKGPGVDRSGDALRHANLAGTSKFGGVLALLGDDHTCESSTTCHQSEFAMMDAMIPVLNPAGVQDIVDFGLFGWALSRYSGCWVGLKCVHDTVEASASIAINRARAAAVIPDFAMPAGGLNIRAVDTPQEQERRLHEYKLPAVQAFARANGIDRTVNDAPDARLGIIATGKAYSDLRQALADLELGDEELRAFGVRVRKLALAYPLEAAGAREFARGLAKIIVVEEKRPLVEDQLKAVLFNQPDAPRVAGKFDCDGRAMFPSAGRLSSNLIADEIGAQLLKLRDAAGLAQRLAELQNRTAAAGNGAVMKRTPYFCAGCPHNISTVVPPGSRARAGIGCHYMAQWMDRATARATQMGGEGASWVGEANFSRRKHVFQNMGDGTYFHSGVLAVRAAVAAKVNITFKILHNDAVAMTGGQPVDGSLSPQRISRQLHAEGVGAIAVVTDDPHKYVGGESFAPGVTVARRDDLHKVQLRMQGTEGVTAIIYDQTCAAEKRRRRKAGAYPDPAKRIFINQAVCEGCGDCGVQSNCVAIVPVETEFGRKRRIDQSACNKDYSCANGFCPSFVTIAGGALRGGVQTVNGGARTVDAAPWPALPTPEMPDAGGGWRIVLAGVGGTGVVTSGALLGMAAHLMGRGCSVLDMMGLAQKGGAVLGHVVVGGGEMVDGATHVPDGGADLLLGFDLVAAASDGVLAKIGRGRTHALLNDFAMFTGEFTRNPDMVFPAREMVDGIRKLAGDENTAQVNATQLAYALLGDSIAANMFMIGYACQAGWLPLSVESLERAIELNGQAVAMNRAALTWGRRAAVFPGRVADCAGAGGGGGDDCAERLSASFAEAVARREKYLRGYQNAALAARYRATVETVAAAEAAVAGGEGEGGGLARAVAENYFKLLAYKDEYEVARLYSDGEFLRRLRREFGGDYKIRFHLAPPFGKREVETGFVRKKEFGGWMLTVFRCLAPFKFLRGTKLDPFGRRHERRRERQLARDYETTVAALTSGLTRQNLTLAAEIARIPESIRGFGHIKSAAMEKARAREEELMAVFCGGAEQRDSCRSQN